MATRTSALSAVTMTIGALWGKLGAVAPLELENDDVMLSRAKHPKIFARTFGARINDS